MWPILGEISLTLGDWTSPWFLQYQLGLSAVTISRKLMGQFLRQGRKEHVFSCITAIFQLFFNMPQCESGVYTERKWPLQCFTYPELKLPTALTASKNQCTTCINNGFLFCVLSQQKYHLTSRTTLVQSVLLQCHANFPMHQNIIIKPNDLLLHAI